MKQNIHILIICINRFKMKKSIGQLLLITILVFLLSGCGLVYRVLLGVDSSVEWLTDCQIKKEFEKNKIPEDQCYVLDTASYFHAVLKTTKMKADQIKNESLTIDSAKLLRIKEDYKDNLQPVQIRYFNRKGIAIFKMINCYMRPFPTQSWNIENCFDVFPPKPISYLKNSNNENLEYFLPHIKSISGSSITIDSLPKANYYALVFWNSFIKRPSKNLIKQLDKYSREFPEQSTYILYVNNNNAEVWYLSDTDEKRKITKSIKQ